MRKGNNIKVSLNTGNKRIRSAINKELIGKEKETKVKEKEDSL